VKKAHYYEAQEPNENTKKGGIRTSAASVGTSVVPTTFRISRVEPIIQNEPPEEITDVATLVQSLKKAAIDREKITVIERFVEQGGEELHYLAEEVVFLSFLLMCTAHS
jgi:hypothetical protein